jgi:hypothetical protein
MSYRSPLPLLAIGLVAAMLIILVVALPTRQAAPVDPTSFTTLTDREALVIVANDVRSGAVAARIIREGKARFEEGTWVVNLDNATFHFSLRNRVVVPDNDAAVALFTQDR